MIIKNKDTFLLQGRNISYIITTNSANDLVNVFFGRKLRSKEYKGEPEKHFAMVPYCENGITLDVVCQEYPSYGHIDLRNPAYCIKNNYGNCISRLKYKNYIYHLIF